MGFSTERSAHNKVRRKKDKTEQKVKVRKQRTTYKTKNTARRKSEGLNKLNWFVNFHSPSEDAMDQYMQDKQNEIPEKEVIFKPFHFLPVFQDFSVPEYCKYSRAARNIVRFTTSMTNSAKGCGSPADRCRDFLVVNNWRSIFAHNARRTDKAILLLPESKRPLKSQIGRLYSGSKIEHTFSAVRALRPGSAPAAQSKHDKKSRKRLYIIIVPPYRRPVNREYWLTKAHKNGLKIR